MYNLQAKAFKLGSGIYVFAAGLLENTCMRAKITGTYPGNVFHIVDPGYAEVFISEWMIPQSIFCAEHLVPWSDRVMIHDSAHKKVALYVNNKKELVVDVISVLPVHNAEAADWIVTALVGAPNDGPFFGCALHHKDDIILTIYKKVFGPSTKKACEDFMKAHCKKLTS